MRSGRLFFFFIVEGQHIRPDRPLALSGHGIAGKNNHPFFIIGIQTIRDNLNGLISFDLGFLFRLAVDVDGLPKGGNQNTQSYD